MVLCICRGVTDDEPRAFPLNPPNYRKAITRLTVTAVFMLSGYVPRRFRVADMGHPLPDSAHAEEA